MMLLAQLVETSDRIAKTSKRLEKIELLSSLLRQLEPNEAEICVAYLSGRARQGRIGVGYATLASARQEPASQGRMTLKQVDDSLSEIEATSGKGSTQLRAERLRALFAQATTAEQDFLFRLLIGELRQGALEGIMVEALAKASGAPIDKVRRAAMMAGDSMAIAPRLLTEGESALHAYDVQLFRPVQPMLAQTAEDLDEAFEELDNPALEYKMDGARVQIHRSGDQVAIYSRRLNEVTEAVPEIVDAVQALPAQDLILDGEVIALQDDGRPRPFQVTMRRFGRRLDVDALRSSLPLTPYFFDLLYVNGSSLLDEPQSKRFEELVRLAPAQVIPHLNNATRDQAQAFVDQAFEAGHEGAMAKATNAPYAAGARGQSWLKIKKATTLDLVILAAEWGNGRRRGFLSNLHLGARDTVNGGFQMLGKTFKGLTDEMLAWQTQELLKLEIARDSYTVYVEPKLVAEIAFNDVQVSPHYSSGLALRFARVKRYRPDKTPDQADTYETVQKLAVSVDN